MTTPPILIIVISIRSTVWLPKWLIGLIQLFIVMLVAVCFRQIGRYSLLLKSILANGIENWG